MIFKTIDSSIDSSRKTLALFNKDWNTYKSNFMNASGGIGNKVSTIFSSNDLNCLKEYNNQLKDGINPSIAYKNTMTNCTTEAKKNAVALAKGATTIEEVEVAQNAAKTSTIGLTIAQTALNAAIGLGVGALVTLVTTGISKLVNAQEDAIEKADEAISKFNEQREALSSNKSTIDEISSEYAKLSQGVDSLGRNVSLNTEEYSRYNEIVNKIADMFPQIVQGYTDEGNAIITNKGNVEALTKAYQDQKKAYQDSLIIQSADTFKGYKSKVDYDANVLWEESGLFQQKDFVESLLKVIDNKDELVKFLDETNASVNEFNGVIRNQTLDKAGIKLGIHWYTGVTAEELQTYKEKLLHLVNTLDADIQTETAKIKPVMQAYMEQSYEYQTLDTDVQDVVSQIVSQFDSEFYRQFNNENEMAAWITENIVSKFQGIDGAKISESFGNVFNLKTQFQNGEIPLDEYLSAVTSFKTLIDGFDDNTKKSVELIFSVNGSSGNSVDTMVNNVKGKLNDEFDDKVGELTLEDLQIASELEISEGTLLSWDELIAKIKETKEEKPDDFSPLSVSNTKDQFASLSALQEIYNDFYEKSKEELDFTFNVSEIESLRENFGEVCDSFDEFESLATNSATSAEELQSAFDRLCNEFVFGSGILDSLDMSTRNQIISQLELQGIMGASALLTEDFTKALMDARNASFDFAEATFTQINSFIAEGKYTDETRQKIYLYAVQKMLANENCLNTAGDITALEKLCVNLGIATDSLSWFSRAKALQFQVDAGSNNKYVLDQLEIAKNKCKELASELTITSQSYTNMAQSAENAAKNKAEEKEIDIMAELNAEMDKLQQAYEDLCDIRDTYNKHGKISVDQYQKLTDMGFNFLSNLVDENGELGVNAGAFEKLSKAKIEEMQIQLARNAIDTINGIESETEATEYLAYANEHLRDAALESTEALLQQAVAAAKAKGEQQGLAAEQIMAGYEAAKQMAAKVDFTFDPNAKEKKEKEKKEFRKTYDWVEKLLDTFSRKTDALIDKVDKFFSWQKKNSMINRAVKATDKEIGQNVNAYRYYMQKANSVGLGRNYTKKIQDGSLSIQDVTNEGLSNKIDQYEELYKKAQDCVDKINELYDKERDLIRQKLDNVLDYYSDLDSYMSSVTSKMESLISLNDSMGKRSSLTELVEQFAELSDRIASTATTIETLVNGKTLVDLGRSDSVQNAVANDKKNLANAVQSQIDNLNVSQSGTYTKLLKNIANYENKIAQYQSKGWDTKKKKSYDKLVAQLNDYYELQKELDNNATSNTVSNYSKIFTAYQKLQNKLDSGRNLTKTEQKRYDSYKSQLDDLKEQGKSAIEELETQLGKINGTIASESVTDSIRKKISDVSEGLENSATYQNLMNAIKATEDKIAELGAKGYDNLTKSQKKTYDKLTSQLEAYYEKKEALDEGATAGNITEYNKIYDAWRKLQDKLDSGGNLSNAQWKQYEDYNKQLEDFVNSKSDILDELNAQLDEALNPTDKTGTIDREYEKASEDLYESYQKQIADINNSVTSTRQYQDLLAKAQKLEQKKDTKGLSKTEEATLKKYNEELEALRKGGMNANVSEYMSTWEKLYALQQKLDKSGKLSASDAKKYDEYKAKLDDWNKEKQTQINDLVNQMQEDLDALSKTYTENIADAKSDVHDYYADLYSLAKQIAEYNISSLESQLALLDASISYYQQLVSLYDNFSGDKLSQLLTDLDENSLQSQVEVYEKYLAQLEQKYDTTLSEIKEYQQLIDAIDTNDFSASMDVFKKAMDEYRANGNNAMADKLQKVLDLLDERAVDADNWGEFADEWLNEWEKALAESKSDLIDTAGSIQDINDALRELRFSNITDAIDELGKAKDTLASIANLINDDLLYEPNGELSEYGRAKVGLLVSQLENAQSMADEYLNLYHEIEKNKDTYASDKEYSDALNEALNNYYASLGDATGLHNSIIDLMQKEKEAEVDALNDIIEARKQALNAKKAYYDYDKTIKDKTGNIDTLKAEIAALSEVDNAATKAKKAQLEAQLKEAEDDLADTKMEHEFNLQMDALDKFSENLKDSLDDSTKTVSEILKEQEDIITSAKDMYKDSADSLQETIDRLIGFYGGIGTSIDGTDIEVPSGNTTDNHTKTPELPNNLVKLSTDEIVQKLSKNFTEPSEKMRTFLENAIKNGIPIIDRQYMDFSNSSLMPKLNSIDSNIINSIQREKPTSVTTNHYDCLLKVDGNVDKDALPGLKQILEQSYDYTTSRLYRESRMLGRIK